MKKSMKLGVKTAAVILGAVTLMSGCGSSIAPDEVAATLNGTDIKAGTANFIAKYNQAQMDGMYGMYVQSGYMAEDYWNQEVTTGSSMQDSSKSNIMDSIEEYYLCDQKKGNYKVEVTEEEQKKISEAAKKFMEDNSSRAIRQSGASIETVSEMLRLMTVQKHVYDAVTDETDIEVSDEDAAQKAISYLTVAIDSYYDDNQNKIEYTEEESKELREKVDNVKLRVDAGDDFDTVVKEVMGEKYSVTSRTFGKDEADLADNVLEAISSLKEGEYTDVLEVEDAGQLWLVRLDSEYDEEATKAKKEELITEKKDEYYTSKIDEWKKDAEWKVNEDVWAKVKFSPLFNVVSNESDTTTDQ